MSCGATIIAATAVTKFALLTKKQALAYTMESSRREDGNVRVYECTRCTYRILYTYAPDLAGDWLT